MMRKRLQISGIVLLVWAAGSITGGAGAYYIAERQTTELRHDHNAFVCVFRSLVIPQRARAVQSQNDPTQSASVRKRAHAAVVSADKVLGGLLTIPRGFDCSTLKPG